MYERAEHYVHTGSENGIDTRFSELQALVNMSEYHNTLSTSDLCSLFDYLNESDRHGAACYRDRQAFSIGLSTGLRSTSRWLITLDQLREEKIRGVRRIVFCSVTGGMRTRERLIRVGGIKQMTIFTYYLFQMISF